MSPIVEFMIAGTFWPAVVGVTEPEDVTELVQRDALKVLQRAADGCAAQRTVVRVPVERCR